MEGPRREDTDLARRKLLAAAAWIPPAIVASVSIGTNHALAYSCGPGPCGPNCCGPDTCCMPDEATMMDCRSEYCMPAGYCMPDRMVLCCMPEF